MSTVNNDWTILIYLSINKMGLIDLDGTINAQTLAHKAALTEYVNQFTAIDDASNPLMVALTPLEKDILKSRVTALMYQYFIQHLDAIVQLFTHDNARMFDVLNVLAREYMASNRLAVRCVSGCAVSRRLMRTIYEWWVLVSEKYGYMKDTAILLRQYVELNDLVECVG